MGAIRSAGIALLVAVGVTTRLPAQIPPLGPEQIVYSPGFNSGGSPLSVSSDSAGNFVVVWEQSDGSAIGVFGQRFDLTGQPQGASFQVNTYTTGNQYFPAVSMSPTGAFVVVWNSNLDEDGNLLGVFGQRFDSNGVPLGGEFQVNTYTTGNQYRPAIATDPLGNFVVCWTSTDPPGGQDGDRAGVFAQRFDSAGNPAGSEFQVNTYTTGDQFGPSVATDSSGNFIVAWTSYGQDGSGDAVIGRRFDSSGNPLSEEFQVNTYTTDNQRLPSVGADSSGGFVVVWTSKPSQDGSAYGIFGQRFDNTGSPAGGEFQVNTYTTSYQVNPSVAVAPTGEFLVSWMSYGQDGSNNGVFAQAFNSSGIRTSSEFQMNSTTTGSQDSEVVALSSSGEFVLGWVSYQQGVVARRGAMLSGAPLLVDTVSPPVGQSNVNGILEPGETVVVAPTWNSLSGSAIQLNGIASNFTGPGGPTYSVVGEAAHYGSIAANGSADCLNATAICYSLQVTGDRPVQHWDATFDEILSPFNVTKRWTLHVGESFGDVPVGSLFYPYVENLFHNQITGGCVGGNYCPSNPVTRAQMSVFLLKAKHGATFTPAPCTGLFLDVACPSAFADWIEELYLEGVTAGCGDGNYCPDNPVTRRQMAVFLLKTKEGAAYAPPPAVGIFGDVPVSDPFAPWIEDLYNRGITGGCQASPLLYCPANQNTRGQMAVFLVKTFGLLLYGP